ncbi:flagellin [Methylobacterium radiodurans]|nr:flagellin [Methylobacterium radiodurans]
MTSILTNSSAVIALQTLRSINSQIDTTNNRFSTGQRISSAADGAAYWAIASTLRSDRGINSAIKSSLALGAAGIDVTTVGLTTTLADLGEIRERLVSAMSENTDRPKLQGEIEILQQKLRTNADTASANGQNWLSVDSGASNPNWTRYANFVLGAPRSDNGTLSTKIEKLDIASLALFDANTVVPHTPLVTGSETIDQIYRLAQSINSSGLSSQITASYAGTNKQGDGTLRLYVRDMSKTIIGSYTNGVAAPVAGVPADHPIDQFGDPQASYVDIAVSDLSAGDVVSFQVSGAPASSFTVTNEGDGIDFSGGSEIHLEIRPFRDKYPAVVYDVLINGSTLAARGFTNLSDVSRWDIVSEISEQIKTQYQSKSVGIENIAEINVSAYAFPYVGLTFSLDASGPHSAIDITIAPPTAGHSAIDIGYGTVSGATTRDEGFQEPDRSPKGILDTTQLVASSFRKNLAGENIVVGYNYVSLAGPGTALAVTPHTTQDQIHGFIQFVDKIINNVTDSITRMASFKAMITGQSELLTMLSDIQQSAIGNLVDADIEEESTKLKALQTQQQLGIQALSIINAVPQNVLSLFR